MCSRRGCAPTGVLLRSMALLMSLWRPSGEWPALPGTCLHLPARKLPQAAVHIQHGSAHLQHAPRLQGTPSAPPPIPSMVLGCSAHSACRSAPAAWPRAEQACCQRQGKSWRPWNCCAPWDVQHLPALMLPVHHVAGGRSSAAGVSLQQAAALSVSSNMAGLQEPVHCWGALLRPGLCRHTGA